MAPPTSISLLDTYSSIIDRDFRNSAQEQNSTRNSDPIKSTRPSATNIDLRIPEQGNTSPRKHDLEKSTRPPSVKTASFSSGGSNSFPHLSLEGAHSGDDLELPMVTSVLIMATVSSISFLTAFNSGLLTVGIRHIATDLDLASNLLLWPSSIYALTLSCTLLLMGSVADVVGNRPVFITGTVLFTAFTLALPLSRSGGELIFFRALQGIAMSCCLPTSVGIVTTTFVIGRMRNIAFAVLGGGWPIGFSVGLVLGGVFVETVGWRAGYYMSCGFSMLCSVGAWYTIPTSITAPNKRKALKNDIDWVGLSIAVTCLALLSYVFSEITSSAAVMRKAENIVFITIAILLIPTFILWAGRQERLGLPAIIPNSIWHNTEFTSICVTVFLMWAAFNAFGYWSTLFLQDIQGVTALQTSVRFLPLVIVSILSNMVAAVLVDKVPAAALLLVGCALSAISPLLLATLNPRWTYFSAEFVAMSLSPVGSDLLFNVANLVVTASFPQDKQARAGGIFNTIAQLGNSFGIAVTAVLAANVTQSKTGEAPIEATLRGYQSAFWMCFAASLIGCFTASLGLRHSGKVGIKRE